jgi:hypothetical protein
VTRLPQSNIGRFNRELGRANEFLASVAKKLAKYLSPQHYHTIFSGEKDVVVATERKKLTIFFSDVVGFTSTSERLQPEELTALLNEYLTEMSRIGRGRNCKGTFAAFDWKETIQSGRRDSAARADRWRGSSCPFQSQIN